MCAIRVFHCALLTHHVHNPEGGGGVRGNYTLLRKRTTLQWHAYHLRKQQHQNIPSTTDLIIDPQTQTWIEIKRMGYRSSRRQHRLHTIHACTKLRATIQNSCVLLCTIHNEDRTALHHIDKCMNVMTTNERTRRQTQVGVSRHPFSIQQRANQNHSET